MERSGRVLRRRRRAAEFALLELRISAAWRAPGLVGTPKVARRGIVRHVRLRSVQVGRTLGNAFCGLLGRSKAAEARLV